MHKRDRMAIRGLFAAFALAGGWPLAASATVIVDLPAPDTVIGGEAYSNSFDLTAYLYGQQATAITVSADMTRVPEWVLNNVTVSRQPNGSSFTYYSYHDSDATTDLTLTAGAESSSAQPMPVSYTQTLSYYQVDISNVEHIVTATYAVYTGGLQGDLNPTVTLLPSEVAAINGGSPLTYGLMLAGDGGNGLNRLQVTIDGVTAPVPEPSCWAFLILGMGLTGARLRSDRRRAAGYRRR